MTKITIHGQKMQYHKIPKCRVSFMTGSGAFSIYDNNGIPVDGTSIEVPVGTILSYVSWVQGTAYQFNIGNISYTVYERNGYSGAKKYLEGITIDGTAFTKGTYTITGDTEIDALGVRNGISITFALSPQPTPTPPLAPTIYPSGVLVNKVTLNYNGYAAIISFDEGESILVPEQQGYEATGASVSAGTALYADTIITVYLQQLVTCNVVELSSMVINPNEFTQTIEYALQSKYSFIKQIQQWTSPQNGYMYYTFYDGFLFHMICKANIMLMTQSGMMINGAVIVAFSTDNRATSYLTMYDYDGQIYQGYPDIPRWKDTGYPYYGENPWNDVYSNNSQQGLQQLMSMWNCQDVCDLTTIIYNLATNK